MRHISATAVLLVFILGMMAPACVAGWDGKNYQLLAGKCEEVPQLGARRCAHRAVKSEHLTRTKPSTHESRITSHGLKEAELPEAGEPCGDELSSRPGQCALRSFIQLHFASFAAAQISHPLLAATKVASPSRVIIVVSSVGPPETDRGPPRC